MVLKEAKYSVVSLVNSHSTMKALHYHKPQGINNISLHSCYTPKDNLSEYYCNICEEERDSKHWFYYYGHCSYPADPECILGKYPYLKFGGVYTFDYHPHPLLSLRKRIGRLPSM